MGRRKARTVENITVIDVADRGKAIGRCQDGEIYILDKAVPGDNVDVIYTKKKKGVKQGIVQKYNSLSDKRVEPFCEHFGNCGGCKWQNMNYESQLHYKHKQVKDALTRIAKVDGAQVLPIKACEKEVGYRNKLEYSFSSHRWFTADELKSGVKFDNKNALGFHPAGSFFKVVDVNKCHLQDDRSDQIRNFIRSYAIEHELAYYNHKTHTGFLRTMIVRNTSIDQWMLIMSFFTEDEDARVKLLDTLVDKFPFITSLNYVINGKRNDTIMDQDIICYHGESIIIEQLGAIKYRIGPKSFFQTNSFQAKVLYDTTMQFADLKKEETLYDLYTGIGSIALYASGECKNVIGIEEVAPAIENAKENALLNNIENCEFFAADVKDLLNKDFTDEYGAIDVLITDPPRAGMHKDVVMTILEAEPNRIVYVSCNAATQARDINILSAKYEHKLSQPVDMFPHTHHIENVALLTLRS